MDYMEKINSLRAEKGEQLKILDNADSTLEQINAASGAMERINAKIALYEKEAADSARRAGQEPGAAQDGGEPGEPRAEKAGKAMPFASLGEQLQAVVRATKQGVADNRLLAVNDAVMGAGSGSGADGGFFIQEDFTGQIMESCVQASDLLGRLDAYTVGSASNAARWLMVNETDVSAAVFGGVQMFWASEGHTVNASKPQFREMKMDLEKMMGFAYATDELLTDAAFMTGFFGTAFSLAADRLLTGCVIAGDGVGKPLGILNSKALITVDKEDGQGAGTLTGANVIRMLGRAMPKNRQNLIWVMHPDLEEQLPYLSITQGDASKFLWNPEGGLGAFDTQRVLNKPVVFEDNCKAAGSAGDILLVDPRQYMLLKKGTARQDWSMHVEFLTDQMCFRIVFRCNGAPKVNKPLTIKNSSKTRSPFVTLAARA